ncbi:MAG: hypothetical protein FWB98_00660 [Defluviitaleaceae bacterium]|nr:hypothetical protein [Defluviitaleaceae bacterium]
MKVNPSLATNPLQINISNVVETGVTRNRGVSENRSRSITGGFANSNESIIDEGKLRVEKPMTIEESNAAMRSAGWVTTLREIDEKIEHAALNGDRANVCPRTFLSSLLYRTGNAPESRSSDDIAHRLRLSDFNLDEMINFIEEQLYLIDNNPDISDERRVIERDLLERAAVGAIAGKLQESFGGAFHGVWNARDIVATRLDNEAANNNMNKALAHAEQLLSRLDSANLGTVMHEIVRQASEQFLLIQLNHTNASLYNHEINRHQGDSEVASGITRAFRNRFLPLIGQVSFSHR